MRVMRSLVPAFLVLTVVSCARTIAAQSQYLTRAAARADLDSLAAIVRSNSAYRLVNGYPFEAHLDSVARTLPDSIALRVFWRSVQAAVGRLQDAHSNVRLPEGVPPTATGVLPFVLVTAADTVVAVAPCRCRLFVAGYPRVVTINDVPIDSLMRVAGIRFVGHSPQRYRLRALESLSPIESVLQLAGAARGGSLTVRLSGAKGDTVVTTQAVARREPAPTRPEAELEIVDSIAVITVRAMSDSADRIVRAAIDSRPFRNSRAVLIDVRGNNGGSRHVMRALVPLFLRTPLVYNVAIPRVDSTGLRGGDYALAVADDPSLPSTARGAVREALASFRPTWNYPAGDFLPVRLAGVLLPAESSRNLSGRPVVVLVDEGCFSSCDIFAGAIRLAPGVTLMGTTSAGGSGRSRDFVLPRSRLTVVLSTMASFQPNGALYDGIGIRPTIVVERTLNDLASGRDTQREAALRFLRGSF